MPFFRKKPVVVEAQQFTGCECEYRNKPTAAEWEE